jgi:hypothetical protein
LIRFGSGFAASVGHRMMLDTEALNAAVREAAATGWLRLVWPDATHRQRVEQIGREKSRICHAKIGRKKKRRTMRSAAIFSTLLSIAA